MPTHFLHQHGSLVAGGIGGGGTTGSGWSSKEDEEEELSDSLESVSEVDMIPATTYYV